MSVPPEEHHEAVLRCFVCGATMKRESTTDTIERNGVLRLDYRCSGCDQWLSYELMTVTIMGYHLSPQQEEVDFVPLAKCARCSTLYDNQGKHICSETFAHDELLP